MKYRVLRNCFGFQGRYWEKGEVVNLDPSCNPPEHFENIEQDENASIVEPIKEQPKKRK